MSWLFEGFRMVSWAVGALCAGLVVAHLIDGIQWLWEKWEERCRKDSKI